MLAERCDPLGVTLFIHRSISAPAEPLLDCSNAHAMRTVLQRLPDSSTRIAKALEAGREVELWPGLWMLPIGFIDEHGEGGFIIALASLECLDPVLTNQGADTTSIDAAARARQTVLTLRRWERDLAAMEEGKASIESMGFQLSEAYEELSLLYKVGQRMTVNESARELCLTVCADLRSVLGFRYTGLLLDPGVVEPFGAADPCFLFDGELPADHDETVSLLTRIRSGHLTDRVLTCEKPSDLPDPAFAALGSSLLFEPLKIDGRCAGLFVAADKKSREPQLTTIDLKLISASLAQLQVFLNNGLLYHRLHRMFMGTLEALTAAIDAKDAYTCGHSLRVALIGSMIARQVGLEPATVERVHVAGLIHDVGKIGVPEAVLCKPGRLSEEEFAFIKRHPEIGARIVRGVPHFEDVIPGVLYHHERFDGKGYPEGRSGADIPLFGRILAVADSFDAMSSNRAYRPALLREKVRSEIERCAGTQFDPELARAFLSLDLSEYDHMLAKHKAQFPNSAPREAA